MKIDTTARNSSLADFKMKLMENPEFREEYYKPTHIGNELGVIRKMKGITQKELAEKIGTTQSGIARAEQWGRWVSLRLLHKMAKALGCYLDIKIYEN